MCEIPTIADYDTKKAKIRCSLQWVVLYAYRGQTEPKLPHADIKYVFESDGGLKKNLATLLCSGDPYCRIAKDVFDIKEHLRSHEDVIQILCRKGLYVLSHADSLITANDLRKMPLDLSSHLAIIGMLMYASVSCKLAPLNSIVSTVKKFAPFSASRDLPDNMEEALLLWLNKVSQKVQCLQRNAMESDKHTFGQSREEELEYPTVSNLTDDMFDGRSLALLLHYYCPNSVHLQDISLKDTISQADAWHNIQIGLEFCNDVLLANPSSLHQDAVPPSILHPVDFLYCGPDLKINMMLFFGTLYHYLETDALQGIVCPLGHVVAAKRQNHHSFAFGEHQQNCDMEFGSRPLTLDEKHQQTLCQVNQIIPGIQPLISDVTKQSFNKHNSDASSMTSSVSASESYATPVPFSAKPVRVKRKQEVLSTQPTSTRFPTQSQFEHFRTSQDQQYVNMDNYANTPYHPSNPQELRNGPSISATHSNPVPNKWQARMQQSARNTNTSNNTHGSVQGVAPDVYGGPYYRQQYDSHSVSDSKSSIPTLLSNVDVGSDPEMENYMGSSGIPSSVNLDWPGFQHIDKTTDVPALNPMRNDLRLETARTSDSQTSRSSRSQTNGWSAVAPQRYDIYSNVSDSTADLTSVSSRTNASEGSGSSSGDSDTTRVRRPSPRRYPDAVVEEYSPERPPMGGHPPGSRSLHGQDAGATSSSIQPSQQSYTVHSRAFHNIDSARAAGYPIIVSSPDKSRHQAGDDPTTSSARPPLVQFSSFAMDAASGDNGPVCNGQATYEEDHIKEPGYETTRYRFPNRYSSWEEDARMQKKHDEAASRTAKHRPRVLSPNTRARLHSQLALKRKEIEEILRQGEEAERELQRERAEAMLMLHREVLALVDKDDACTVALKGKNEETSSDYSSKSPSPSGVSPNERVEYGQPTPVLRNTNQPVHVSSRHDYFASPLSTTYLALGADRPTTNLHQSYQSNSMMSNASAPAQETSNQKKTFIVSNPNDPSLLATQNNLTYNVSQRRQTPQQHSTDQLLPAMHNNLTYNVSQQRQTPQQQQTDQSLLATHNNLTYNISQRSERPQQNVHSAFQPQTVLVEPNQPNPGLTVVSAVPVAPVPNHAPAVRQKPSVETESEEKSQADPRTTKQSMRGRSSRQQSPRRGDPLVVQKTPKQDHVVQLGITAPDIHVVSPPTRRSLFPGGGRDATSEQENIDPNNRSTGQPSLLGTYDSFCKLPAGSNHSTPAKSSPVRYEDSLTSSEEDDTEVSSLLLKTGDRDGKGGKGFELLDEATPNTALAKKKEQFLLKQLKKEEKLKREKADREKVAEKKREEARKKQEEVAAKKEEEKQKREQRLEEYRKRLIETEVAKANQQSATISTGGSAKKHHEPGTSSEQSQHSGPTKTTRSGRSSPAPDATRRKIKKPAANESPPGTNCETFTVGAQHDENGNDLGNVNPVRTRKLSSSSKKDWETGSVTSDYAGPKLYKQPTAKSNKNIVHNAVNHCCLPGKVNESLRLKVIKALDTSEERHFMVLFRDAYCQFRALYMYDPESEKLHRLCGHGPITIMPSMIERLFKYNSGRKAFAPLPSKTLSVGIDAITIKNNLWQPTKKASSNASKK